MFACASAFASSRLVYSSQAPFSSGLGFHGVKWQLAAPEGMVAILPFCHGIAPAERRRADYNRCSGYPVHQRRES